MDGQNDIWMGRTTFEWTDRWMNRLHVYGQTDGCLDRHVCAWTDRCVYEQRSV